jgi:hypothetical protein
MESLAPIVLGSTSMASDRWEQGDHQESDMEIGKEKQRFEASISLENDDIPSGYLT